MAKKKKKCLPKINKKVGKERTETIETDDYRFDITYKVPGASSVLSIMLDQNDSGESGDVAELSMGPGFIGILVDSISSWTIDAPVSKESIDGLPMSALAAIFSKVVAGIAQEKN